jgi:phosphotriesterase-related protein
MTCRDERFQYGRRRALALLGAGAALGVAAGRGMVSQLFAAAPQREGGGQAVSFPRGSLIRTVKGDIEPSSIGGATLIHEHLGTGRPGGERGSARGSGQVDNPTQDADWMTVELNAAHKAGLGCIVAAQTSLAGPENLGYLTLLSDRTGLHVVAAGAHYNKQSYPPDFETKSQEAIADGLVEAAKSGRAGAFGELGVGNNASDLAPVEKKVFGAYGRAQARTGIPIFTHNNYSTGPDVPMDMGLRQLDALEAGGGKPQSIAIGHVCCLDDPMADVAKRIARRGAFVAFDRVTRQQQWVSDEKRLHMIQGLLDAGLVDNLLLSSDYIGRVNTAVGEVNKYPGPLHARDGGPGYARPLVLFVPLMRKAGISDATIRRVTVDNPRRFLAFVPKPA